MSKLSEYLLMLRGEASLYEVEKATGIRRTQLQRYEKGVRIPTREILKKLAGYYGVPYERLLNLYLDELFPCQEERRIIQEWAAQQNQRELYE